MEDLKIDLLLWIRTRWMMIIGGIDYQKKKDEGPYAWKFYKQPGAVIEYRKDDLPENPEANGFIYSSGKVVDGKP